MTRKARSARGDIVDFDMLAIKQQLSALPVPVGVNQRRKFVDDRDRVRAKTVKQQPADLSALQTSIEAAAISSTAGSRKTSAKKARDN